MSNIRVTYSGLLAFFVGIVSVITGTLFIIIVTRKLSPEELGLWTLIGSLISYVLIIEPIISFWTKRQIARGEEVGKTALTTSLLFALGGILAYFIISVFISSTLTTDFFPIILAILLVPISFANNTLNGICLSYKPQGISYSMVVFEISKLPLGLAFVYFLELGIIGAIVATIIASLAKMIILLIIVKEKLIGTIKLHIIKFWLRLSWIPLYNSGAGFLLTLDVLIFSIITNSLVGLAFWGVGNAVGNLVLHTGLISQAIYPKMLATAKKEFAEENLQRLLFFAIPILAATIVFAKPALHILNPFYIEGIYIVYFLSLRTLFQILITFSYSVWGGFETIDLNKNASFKQYVKSKLFLIPSLNYIRSGSYVAILALFLILVSHQNLEEVVLVTIWSAITVAVAIPFMLQGLISLKKNYQISFPFKVMLKYSTVALLSSIVVYLVSENFLIYSESIYDFIPQLVPIIILGGIMYFGITYVIDESSRKLFKLIINEFRVKKN